MEKKKRFCYSVELISHGNSIDLLYSNNKKRIRVDANKIIRKILCEELSPILAIEHDIRKNVDTRRWMAYLTKLNKIAFM